MSAIPNEPVTLAVIGCGERGNVRIVQLAPTMRMMADTLSRHMLRIPS
jgi:hypothetical protein